VHGGGVREREAPGMMELRDYQIRVKDDVERAVETGRRHVLAVAPTGSGKTVVAAEIIRDAVSGGKRVLVLGHTREIIRQTSIKLYSYSVEHGIVQAGLVANPERPVQVASIQTLWTRAMRLERMPLPPADLLIVDEAHHCPAETYRKIIAEYPNAVLLGLTATPCRGDGRGLGDIFDIIVECPQVADLIAQGHLVRTRVYAPIDPDLRGVETRQGDYVESQLAGRMDRDNLVGDIVSHWHRYGERRRTVCFAVNVAHSIHIRNEFIKSGVKAEHVDGSTPKPDRDAALARLASGDAELITNCMVLTEGWDLPAVSCGILARPTKKMGLYRQMIGRLLRPAPGKCNAIVLDHSGAVFRHGFVEDDVNWTLNPERRAASPKHAARLAKGPSSRLVECSQCGSIRTGGEACEHCGFLPQRPPRAIVFGEGDLGLVDRTRRTSHTSRDPIQQMRWHGMLMHIAGERGYKPGWIAHKFKEKFGYWPPSSFVTPIEPTPEVRSWVRSRAIAFAKGRDKRGPEA
jgi:DNA repair protein RadD